MMEKFKFLLILLMIGLMITYQNCSLDVDNDDGRLIIGEGPVVIKSVQADTFSIFQHLAIGDVSISTGDSLEITVRAQQNIMDEMEFKFVDGIFVWGFREPLRIEDSDSIFMTIKMPNEIEAVQMGGIGTFYIGGNKQNKFIVDAAGLSDFYCYNLEVDTCEIYISGVSTCYVKVNEEINGAITGKGDIYYRGEPEISVAIYGDGNIRDDN